MDRNAVKKMVEQEIKQLSNFQNYHGITPENILHFFVEPFEIYVDPDDLATQPRNMWVVLQEYEDIKKGYSVVFDPLENMWGVAEHVSDDNFVLVVGADTLLLALERM